MADGSAVLLALVTLSWATLAALSALFLRMAMRSDAGWGAAGRGRDRASPPRHDGFTPPPPDRHGPVTASSVEVHP